MNRLSKSWCCVVLLWSLSAGLGAAEAGIFKTVRGQVEVERRGAVAAVAVGDTVLGGDTVRVRGDGSAGISLKDETLLGIGPGTEMTIDTFAYDPTTRAGAVDTSLLKGTLRYVTGLIGRQNPAAVKVVTPNATIGIRGTDFIVEVPDGGRP